MFYKLIYELFNEVCLIFVKRAKWIEASVDVLDLYENLFLFFPYLCNHIMAAFKSQSPCL